MLCFFSVHWAVIAYIYIFIYTCNLKDTWIPRAQHTKNTLLYIRTDAWCPEIYKIKTNTCEKHHFPTNNERQIADLFAIFRYIYFFTHFHAKHSHKTEPTRCCQWICVSSDDAKWVTSFFTPCLLCMHDGHCQRSGG